MNAMEFRSCPGCVVRVQGVEYAAHLYDPAGSLLGRRRARVAPHLLVLGLLASGTVDVLFVGPNRKLSMLVKSSGVNVGAGVNETVLVPRW